MGALHSERLRRLLAASLSALLTAASGCRPPPSSPPPLAEPIEIGHTTSAPRAPRLSTRVVPSSYALDLTIDPRRKDFSGVARIEVDLERPMDAIALHAKGLRITRASVTRRNNTERLSAEVAEVAEVAALPSPGLIELRPRQTLEPGHALLTIEYTADFDEQLLGLYRIESAGQAYAFTQFEAIHARQAFPCFDEPLFKTPFEITLRVPTGATAISNTAIASQTDLQNGTTEVRFARTEKLPTYLVAFAVGPLDVVSHAPIAASDIRKTPLPLRGVAARGRGAELKNALNETPALLAGLERYLGEAYPYDKLDLIAVPDFAAGAMENAGAITFRDTLLLQGADSPEWQRRASISVNAHELAHQWFGNLVTMPWWDDIWLNEAFATWLAGRSLDELHPEFNNSLARVAAVDIAMDVDSRESARQIRQPIQSDDDIENAFDAITYVKGSAVLGMFEKYLGAAIFQRGLQLYLAQHRFGSATSDDLVRALEQSSGKKLRAALFSFLDQPGVPNLSVELDCTTPTKPKVHLRQTRYVPLGSRAARDRSWQVPVCIRHGQGDSKPAAEGSGNNDQCILLAGAEAELDLATDRCPRWLVPNAGAKGYYRWSLAPTDFDALVARGFDSLGTAEQLSLLSNAEALTRSGELSLAALLSVTRRVGGERPRESLQAALSVLVRLRDALLTPSELVDYRRLVRSLVAPRFESVGVTAPLTSTPKQQTGVESGDVKLLRPLVVGALALDAKDEPLRRELDRFGRSRLDLTPDPGLPNLPSELVEIALSVSVQMGGAPVVDHLVKTLETSTDGVERSRALSALGNNEDPTLTPRILELVLGKSLRNNERASPIRAQTRVPSTRDVAYGWVLQHFDQLVARLGRDNASPLVQIVGNFCSENRAQEARTFFNERIRQIAGGPRLLQLALEDVEACAAFADRYRASATAEFAKVAKSGG